MGPCKDSFTSLYADDVQTSQDKILWASKLCYGDYEEREVGGSDRQYGWGEQNLSSVLKVPRHCPFILLESVSF
jgi:hypothetical protein